MTVLHRWLHVRPEEASGPSAGVETLRRARALDPPSTLEVVATDVVTASRDAIDRLLAAHDLYVDLSPGAADRPLLRRALGAGLAAVVASHDTPAGVEAPRWLRLVLDPADPVAVVESVADLRAAQTAVRRRRAVVVDLGAGPAGRFRGRAGGAGGPDAARLAAATRVLLEAGCAVVVVTGGQRSAASVAGTVTVRVPGRWAPSSRWAPLGRRDRLTAAGEAARLRHPLRAAGVSDRFDVVLAATEADHRPAALLPQPALDPGATSR